MTIQEFIEENRAELVSCIQNVIGPNFEIDDDEVENWVMNDESLYNWALSENVEDI